MAEILVHFSQKSRYDSFMKRKLTEVEADEIIATIEWKLSKAVGADCRLCLMPSGDLSGSSYRYLVTKWRYKPMNGMLQKTPVDECSGKFQHCYVYSRHVLRELELRHEVGKLKKIEIVRDLLERGLYCRFRQNFFSYDPNRNVRISSVEQLVLERAFTGEQS